MENRGQWERAKEVEIFSDSVAFSAGLASAQKMRSISDLCILLKKQRSMARKEQVILSVGMEDMGKIGQCEYRTKFVIKYCKIGYAL